MRRHRVWLTLLAATCLTACGVPGTGPLGMGRPGESAIPQLGFDPPQVPEDPTAIIRESILPSVAFNPVSNQYLVAWEQALEQGVEIRATFIDGKGNQVGPAFTVAPSNFLQSNPKVVFNPKTSQFLVAWSNVASAESPDADIHARLINADSSFGSGELVVSSAVDFQLRPDVAVDTNTGQYLVTWLDNRNSEVITDEFGTFALSEQDDVFGQFLNPDGSQLGGDLPLSIDPGIQRDPKAAFSPDTGSFLVVWTDHRSGPTDIFGQQVLSGGGLIGSNFPVSDHSKGQNAPTVAYDTHAKRFLVAWFDFRNGNSDLFGQQIRPDGSRIGANLSISSHPAQQYFPSLAYAPSEGEFIMTWYDNRKGSFDIFAKCIELDDDPEGENDDWSDEGIRIQNLGYDPNDAEYENKERKTRRDDEHDRRRERLEADGAFTIAVANHAQTRPAVAIGNSHNKFLAVWSDARDGLAAIFAELIQF